MLSEVITRRAALGFLAGGMSSLALPRMALALNEQSAMALVNKLVADITKVINSGKSENAVLRDFDRIFGKYADVPIIARYSLGADARRATPAQLREFTKAYQSYISRKYGRRFREFIGGRIEVQSARPIKAGYEVRTLAYIQGESPFEVVFLVSDKSGSDKFFNIFIEGVNMLLTERTEIGAIIDRNGGDLDKTIADLKKAN